MRRAALLLATILFVACVGEDPDTSSSSSSSSSSSASSGGSGPSARVVQCNDKKCATGEVCCLTLGGSSVDKAECTPQAACTTGTALVCDNTADCASGERCCVKTNGGSVRYGPSFCSPSCASPDRQLCASSDECNGKACAPPQSATTPTNLMQCAE